MEEQVAYSTVVFKNGYPFSKPQKEDKTIYSDVKKKAPAAALKSAPETGDKKAVHGRDFYVLAALLVVVCVLLVGSIAVLVYLAIMMTNQRAENQLSAQRDPLQNSTEQLMKQKSELEKKTQLLSREKNELLNLTQDLRQRRDSLNWTLGVIMTFDNFSVNSFCPQKQCQPCLNGWISFKDHCYFFNETAPWKQWDQSQTFCKSLNPISDLVVIKSLEEQEFIHNRTKYYHDEFHGFWIGLQNASNNWVWVDGQTDTLGFWMKKNFGTPGPKALMIPNQPLNKSWAPAENKMLNKFICESKALIKE